MLRKTVLRLTAIMVITAMMMLSGCSFFDKIQKQIDPNSVKIAAPELIRLMVTGIDDPAQIADSYEAIPESQREGINYSYYVTYINIIREMSTGNGKIKSFRLMNDEDNSEHLLSVFDKFTQRTKVSLDSFDHYLEPYGNIRTVVFEYGVEPDHPVYAYYSIDDDGFAKLSDEWITDVVDIYNYMQHYLGSIDEQNTDGIASLIRKSSKNSGTELEEKRITAKAEYISEFYKYRVRNNVDEFRLNAANAFYTEYQIPEVISSDGNGIYTRTVSSYGTHNSNNDIIIYDDIPQEADDSIAKVNISQVQSITCGLEYNYSAITRILGKPLWTYIPKENIQATVDSDGNEILKKRIVLSYNGLCLVFNAVYSGEPDWMMDTVNMSAKNYYNVIARGDKEWVGELVSIRVVPNSKQNYSVCDIGIGNSELDLIERFPMLDPGKYTLSFTKFAKTYNLKYTLDKDGLVDSILITRTV